MNADEISEEEFMPEQKTLITVIGLKNPVSQMSEEDLDELTDYAMGQPREPIPAPRRSPRGTLGRAGWAGAVSRVTR
jgi:hypothetical protein